LADPRLLGPRDDAGALVTGRSAEISFAAPTSMLPLATGSL